MNATIFHMIEVNLENGKDGGDKSLHAEQLNGR